MGGTKKVGILVIMVGVLALAASLAQAELTARGDLFVKFSGGIAPDALPRDARAPITVQVAGTVRTLSGERPPALRRIEIAINQGGRLDAHGLPVCSRRQIQPSSTAEALARCGPALVGDGSYDADVAFPEQSAFPSHGRVLAFNAVVDGKRAILAHVYADRPIPITRIVVFRIRQTQGTYGTILTGSLPASVNRWGYLKQISLSLHRNFTYKGQRRSYLSAACDAPAGFPGATFPFANASMTFADGRTLSSTLTRSCKVRDQ
ncbi:MAG TPA: hypothetical protein VEW07_00500 [Solirubrobacterales bacterium]|nr:hypothetical protein [Solirubrobacterales bacterium]